MSNTSFSPSVCNDLGNYVYRLIDPRNGETFYVGKGRGNRVFAHVNAALTLEATEDQTSAKIERIHDIRRSGLEVIHVIHRHGVPDEAIFEVEAALIDAYSGLSNIAGGHNSNDRGPMHATQIIDKYDLPEIDWEPEHKLVLINVNKFESSGRDALYQQVRFSWRIDPRKAEKADYLLAVVRGVVVGAFEADTWHPATPEFFPEIEHPDAKRHAFIGRPASDEIWTLYCGERGKRIAVDKMKHIQNPIRYWNI
ncbi:hypothetical protein KUV39_15020 [Phaeobacter italicus]|jgi:hypothetical protein|uniref:LEM-3-like GIY-YIG domain-containing protein n=2 Tax=Phaeobacter italicus TaxID=481446 RepID=UPI001C939F02|nr:hypothetical protein [Phaeobacter italicus]MBY5977961.1 hypothetical protein [Phaeobacter italicus]MEC8574941.1 hypothetical protein [Pseudomonadota bacterium]